MGFREGFKVQPGFRGSGYRFRDTGAMSTASDGSMPHAEAQNPSPLEVGFHTNADAARGGRSIAPSRPAPPHSQTLAPWRILKTYGFNTPNHKPQTLNPKPQLPPSVTPTARGLFHHHHCASKHARTDSHIVSLLGLPKTGGYPLTRRVILQKSEPPAAP